MRLRYYDKLIQTASLVGPSTPLVMSAQSSQHTVHNAGADAMAGVPRTNTIACAPLENHIDPRTTVVIDLTIQSSDDDEPPGKFARVCIITIGRVRN